MSTQTDRDTDSALAAMGYRRATSDEPGWYVMVRVRGAVARVWATDAPATAVAREEAAR